jgi:signal transduction histidine kinase
MRTILSWLLLVSFWVFGPIHDCCAQQNDSLILAIGRTDDDSIKADLYSQLAEQGQRRSFRQSVEYGQKALDHAQKGGHRKQVVDVMYQLAYAYMSTGNAAASIDILQQILPLTKNENIDLYGTALAFISMNYTKQNDYKNALKYMREALALEPQLKASRQSLTQQSYLASRMNIADIFARSNQIDSAIYYGKIAYDRLKGEQLQPQSLHFAWNIPWIYGDAHRKANHNGAAKKLYGEALQQAQKQRYQTAINDIKLSLAYLFNQMGQPDSSLIYAHEALAGFERSADYPQLSEAGLLLYGLYKHQKNGVKALQYFEIGMAARDSILNRERVVQVQYLTDKQERQQREADIEREKTQTRQRLYFLLVSLSLLGLITVLLYANNRQKQRLNNQLARQKTEIETLNGSLEHKVEQRTAELQNALNEVQTAFGRGQSTERRRVSADLHDEIGSALSTIAVFSDITRRKAHKMAPDLVDELEKIGAKSRETVQTMRDTIWTLNDDPTQNLWERMEQYSLEILSANGIALNWQVSPNELPNEMPFLVKRNLFLAYKEAVHNVVKHAEATILTVDAIPNPAQIELGVEDNGKGFDPEMAQANGNGLQNFQKRMAEINGTVHLASSTGQGTRLTFTIPRSHSPSLTVGIADQELQVEI